MEELSKIRERRLEGLEGLILFYEERVKNGCPLNEEQRQQLREAANIVSFFGEYGSFLHEIAVEVLKKSKQ